MMMQDNSDDDSLHDDDVYLESQERPVVEEGDDNTTNNNSNTHPPITPSSIQNVSRRRRKITQGLNRSQMLGILIVVALTWVAILAVMIVTLTPSKHDGNESNSAVTNGDAKNLESTATLAPTLSAINNNKPTATSTKAPSSPPTTSPSMAPTIPVMGCRGDRFDNEGNLEANHRLFAGQYVCSDDEDQRYWFGIDPETGNLMMRDSLTAQIKTYYTHQTRRNLADADSTLAYMEELEAMSVVIDHSDTKYYNDCGEEIPTEDFIKEVASSISGSKTKTHDNVNSNCTDKNVDTKTDDDIEEVEEADTNTTTTATTTSTPLFLDYYFSMSTEAAFRIHRVMRTADYNIVAEALHWELPVSNYNITQVYKNCLKTHDCPYLHLHQDGVMVLAWFDYTLAWDGWMEKNIRRCYDFDTTDEL